jgi:hypothetical protein
MEIFADWERDYNGAFEGLPSVVEFMKRIETSLPSSPFPAGMYTGYYFFVENSDPSTNASQYNYLKTRPLWLGNYNQPQNVLIPPPWRTWIHWQHGTPIEDYGQESQEIDKNKFNGDSDAFRLRYGTGTVAPPPNGGAMHYLQLKNNSNTSYSSIREPHPDSHIQGKYIGQISAGGQGKGIPADTYKYTSDKNVNGVLRAKAGDIWHHANEANGYLIDGWVAEIHLGKRYLEVIEVGSPAEPPPSLPITVESVDTWKDAAGNTIATYKGTLTRQ